jgi:hypothetical protein
MLAPMHGWEAVMAALGGLLLGAGLGVGLSRREVARATLAFQQRVRELDRVALPWLKARAEALGAPESVLQSTPDGTPLSETLALVEVVQRLEREDLLPFSDTMEVDALPGTRGARPRSRDRSPQ